MRITLSLVKANIESKKKPADVLDLLRKNLEKEKGKTIVDYHLLRCGGDVGLLMTHEHGANSKKAHSLVRDTLQDVASRPGLSDACEIEIIERPEEVFVVFMLDATKASAVSQALYGVFADPLNTTSLVADPKLHEGFKFEVHDIGRKQKIILDAPGETYDILALIDSAGMHNVAAVYKKDGIPAAAVSSEMANIIVRAQYGFPEIREVLTPFAKMHKKLALAFSIKAGKLSEPINVFEKPPPPTTGYPAPSRVLEKLKGRFRKLK